MRNSRFMQGLTLVELLVVISIVLLLAAIMQPVISSAKKSAQRSSCSSRLSQIGAALIMYGAENNDYFPSATDQYLIDHRDGWASNGLNTESFPKLPDLLLHYLGSREVLQCPNDHFPQMRVVGETQKQEFPTFYAYNGTSFDFFLPQWSGTSQSRYPASYFPIAKDYDPRWHGELQGPAFSTPAYNFLYADTHVVFQSLADAALAMHTATSGQ